MLNSINLLSPLQVLLGLALGCLSSFFMWNQFLIPLAASYQLVKLRLFPAWHCWQLCFLPCFLFLWAYQWTNKRALIAEHTGFFFFCITAGLKLLALCWAQDRYSEGDYPCSTKLEFLMETWCSTWGRTLLGELGSRDWEEKSAAYSVAIVHATGQAFSQIWHLYGFYQVYC